MEGESVQRATDHHTPRVPIDSVGLRHSFRSCCRGASTSWGVSTIHLSSILGWYYWSLENTFVKHPGMILLVHREYIYQASYIHSDITGHLDNTFIKHPITRSIDNTFIKHPILTLTLLEHRQIHLSNILYSLWYYWAPHNTINPLRPIPVSHWI